LRRDIKWKIRPRGVSARRLPEITRKEILIDPKVLSFFFTDEPIELAHDAICDLSSERSLYFSLAKGSPCCPTKAPVVFPPIDVNPVPVIGDGAYS
jgi:hypothetical protein